MPESLDDAYVAELQAIAATHGITRTGVAGADVMHRARAELVRRRDAGLHDGMQFTYKNPDRSTDPEQAVRGARAVFVGARPYLLDEPEVIDGSADTGWIDRVRDEGHVVHLVEDGGHDGPQLVVILHQEQPRPRAP